MRERKGLARHSFCQKELTASQRADPWMMYVETMRQDIHGGPTDPGVTTAANIL